MVVVEHHKVFFPGSTLVGIIPHCACLRALYTETLQKKNSGVSVSPCVADEPTSWFTYHAARTPFATLLRSHPTPFVLFILSVRARV